MKILYIPLNEYDTLEDLYKGFNTIAKEDNVSLNLYDNQASAKGLLNVLGNKTCSRVFYWETATFDEVTRYVMYEALFD